MNRIKSKRAVRKRAFTLIELLVVIAIIAILAAILFPVFAQAKLAAKGSASLSNTKQEALGVIMYAGDVDDMWPLATTWNGGNDQYSFGANHSFSPWSYNMLPYIKSSDIFMDPIPGGNNGWSGSGSRSVWESYNAEYGYNVTLLNGGIRNAVQDVNVGPEPGALSATSISRPADMVMLTIDTLHTDPGYEIDAYAGFITLGVIEGPWCDYTQANSCSDLSSYWGTDNGWAGTGHPYNQAAYIEGSDTSGVALRAPSQRTEVAFTDGHSKSMSAGDLAVGTNWNPTMTKSQVKANANIKDVYRWWQY